MCIPKKRRLPKNEESRPYSSHIRKIFVKMSTKCKYGDQLLVV